MLNIIPAAASAIPIPQLAIPVMFIVCYGRCFGLFHIKSKPTDAAPSVTTDAAPSSSTPLPVHEHIAEPRAMEIDLKSTIPDLQTLNRTIQAFQTFQAIGGLKAMEMASNQLQNFRPRFIRPVTNKMTQTLSAGLKATTYLTFLTSHGFIPLAGAVAITGLTLMAITKVFNKMSHNPKSDQKQLLTVIDNQLHVSPLREFRADESIPPFFVCEIVKLLEQQSTNEIQKNFLKIVRNNPLLWEGYTWNNFLNRLLKIQHYLNQLLLPPREVPNPPSLQELYLRSRQDNNELVVIQRILETRNQVSQLMRIANTSDQQVSCTIEEIVEMGDSLRTTLTTLTTLRNFGSKDLMSATQNTETSNTANAGGAERTSVFSNTDTDVNLPGSEMVSNTLIHEAGDRSLNDEVGALEMQATADVTTSQSIQSSLQMIGQSANSVAETSLPGSATAQVAAEAAQQIQDAIGSLKQMPERMVSGIESVVANTASEIQAAAETLATSSTNTEQVAAEAITRIKSATQSALDIIAKTAVETMASQSNQMSALYSLQTQLDRALEDLGTLSQETQQQKVMQAALYEHLQATVTNMVETAVAVQIEPQPNKWEPFKFVATHLVMPAIAGFATSKLTGLLTSLLKSKSRKAVDKIVETLVGLPNPTNLVKKVLIGGDDPTPIDKKH